MRQRREGYFRWPLLFLAVWCLTSLPLAAAADPLVTAHYSQQRANAGMLQLAIAAPAPSPVIVSLNLPEGSDIVSASPGFKKRSKKNRQVKWLLKDVRPGSTTISFELSGPLSFSQLNCIVQYMDPAQGRMVTLKVTE